MSLPLVQETILLSADSMEETPENATLFGGQQISQDLLNKIAPSGMPPHKLTLEEGAPVMLLRNMHGARGQANGTRMLIRKIHSRVVEAEIVTGCSIGKVVFIPRINSNPTDSTRPFEFRRRQFPLRPAFAMTINKAQGQTLRMAGLYLPSQPFSHGQLYVAKTRVGSRNALRMVVKCGKVRDREGVYVENVVHKELLLR